MKTREQHPSRRRFLQLGGSASLGTGLLFAAGGPGIRCGMAAEQARSFQLSWIKSIQYGGYFAGIERGIFKKLEIEPAFVSGGPNVDPVVNVAAGQSQLGDRPVGPLIIAREKGLPIKIIGTV